MNACAKKPSYWSSAFCFLALTFLPNIVVAKETQAYCESSKLGVHISRGDVAGGHSQSVAINNVKRGQLLIGTPIDLNIQADVEGGGQLSGEVTTEVSDMIWRVRARNNGGIKGFLTADYQFNGLALNDNRICSSTNSCIVVKSVENVISVTERARNGRIMEAEGRVRLTLDLSNVKDSGGYSSNVAISIFENWKGDQALIDCI